MQALTGSKTEAQKQNQERMEEQMQAKQYSEQINFNFENFKLFLDQKSKDPIADILSLKDEVLSDNLGKGEDAEKDVI